MLTSSFGALHLLTNVRVEFQAKLRYRFGWTSARHLILLHAALLRYASSISLYQHSGVLKFHRDTHVAFGTELR
ncbi:uncharacterized protein K460DRAFT_362202, partial [Cucurbitaria berberidis CBS 394.84]